VVERRWDLPVVAGGHALGDLIVTTGGDVYVTDSNQPVLYRLRARADTVERFRHALFRSLQGMAATPDGKVLYVADYAHGLLRMSTATGEVLRLDDAPHGTSLGCDGIAYDGGALIAVQNGVAPARLMRFVLDADGRRIVRAELLDRNVDVADEPTSVIVVGREAVYVADSQWEKHDDAGVRVAGAALRAPILLVVPLPSGHRSRPVR
jgi:sugar lactone lactonase YvrE